MNQKHLSIIYATILAIFAAKSAKVGGWFMSLPVFWMVVICMTVFFAFVMLIIRAFGGVDFLQLIGL